MMEATLQKVDGSYVLRFERQLQHPVEKVWAALTEPERIAEWLAHAVVETVEGGKYELRYTNTDNEMLGRITRVEAPALLEYIWNNDGAHGTVVRWEVRQEQEGCLLVMTHTFFNTEELAEFAAGWHVHLDLLEEALAGHSQEWSWSSWEAWNAAYGKKFGVLNCS